MEDKKNDDFIVRMPNDSSYNEKDSFVLKTKRSSHNVSPPSGPPTFSSIENSPLLSVIAYCFSSISMTVVNKYVVSGSYWNLTFFYLAVQVSSPIPGDQLEDLPEQASRAATRIS